MALCKICRRWARNPCWGDRPRGPEDPTKDCPDFKWSNEVYSRHWSLETRFVEVDIKYFDGSEVHLKGHYEPALCS